MAVYQHYETSFQYDGRRHTAGMHIEQAHIDRSIQYRAVIDGSPLHGTFGGYAETIAMALDFLNLAMQAEGADEISFTPLPTGAAG